MLSYSYEKIIISTNKRHDVVENVYFCTGNKLLLLL